MREESNHRPPAACLVQSGLKRGVPAFGFGVVQVRSHAQKHFTRQVHGAINLKHPLLQYHLYQDVGLCL